MLNMTTNLPHTSNKNKELHNRLMILEKFIELKTNECAYYRTKVHLMQMSSCNSQSMKKTSERSSSEDISHSQLNRQRRSSVPLSSRQKSSFKKNLNHPYQSNSSIPIDEPTKSKNLPFSSSTRRYRKEINDRNQNYFDENCSHPSFVSKDKNLIDQILVSYINKHLQQIVSQDKTIQCNDHDFHPIETSSKSPHTVLTIRLPRRFVKTLTEQQKKPTTTTPKLKVHISSELLNKLFQSVHVNSINTNKNHHQINKFTIQSQFGTVAACINHDDSIDQQESKAVHAKAEVKTHHEDRLPIIRHLARTKSDGSERKKIITEKNLHKHRHYRKKKRHLHKLSSSSHDEIDSLTNITQSIETLPSSDQLSVDNNKIKKNKRN